MKMEKSGYEKMYAELEEYEKNMARENVDYMRDYEIDSEGHIESLSFININRRRRKNY